MDPKRSIKEILEDMRCRGDCTLTQFANELEEAVNHEFAEFASELKASFVTLLSNCDEDE